MSHPVVQAVENEVNKARDQLEHEESKLSRLEASVKVERDDLKKLRRHLRSTKKMFDPDSLKKADLEEEAEEDDEPIRVAAPPAAPEPTAARAARYLGEDSYNKFRTWVYTDKERVFSAAEGAALSGMPQGTFREAVRVAVERGLIVDVGPYRPEGFEGGRLPTGYRYNDEVKSGPAQPSAEGLSAPAQPVAGVGNDFGGVHKDIKTVIAKAISQQNAEVFRNGGGHLKLRAPGKHAIILPDSPGGRALKNLKRDMRNNGYVVS